MQNQDDIPIIMAIAPYINGAIYLYLWYMFPAFFTALTAVFIVLIALYVYLKPNEQQIASLNDLWVTFVAASLLLLMLLTVIVVIMLFMGYAPLIIEIMRS
ncbi:MAG: hypothetical protein QM484_08695 [Woeseiaceae bacterium]